MDSERNLVSELLDQFEDTEDIDEEYSLLAQVAVEGKYSLNT